MGFTTIEVHDPENQCHLPARVSDYCIFSLVKTRKFEQNIQEQCKVAKNNLIKIHAGS